MDPSGDYNPDSGSRAGSVPKRRARGSAARKGTSSGPRKRSKPSDSSSTPSIPPPQLPTASVVLPSLSDSHNSQTALDDQWATRGRVTVIGGKFVTDLAALEHLPLRVVQCFECIQQKVVCRGEPEGACIYCQRLEKTCPLIPSIPGISTEVVTEISTSPPPTLAEALDQAPFALDPSHHSPSTLLPEDLEKGDVPSQHLLRCAFSFLSCLFSFR